MKKILLVWLILCGSLQAKDLGDFGPTYLIREVDAFEWIINHRLPELEKTGAVDAMNKKLLDKSRKRIENPKGVSLPQVKIANKRLQSLLYILPKNIKDAKGHVLFAKGKTVNPTDFFPESKKTLLFIDGSSKQQVDYALGQLSNNKFIKIVLVCGQPLELMRTTKSVIYFDQEQSLVQRFAIKAVPTKIYREKSNLIIEEIVI